MNTFPKNILLVIFLTIWGIATAQNVQTDSTNLLENAQQKILESFGKAQKKQNVEPLKLLDTEFKRLYKEKNTQIALYWRAYNQYYMSIYYLIEADKSASENAIDQAVNLLEDIKNKSSEDYALLAITQGFSMQFKSIIKIMLLSQRVNKNGELAIEKDAENIRAYYALASNDFYRPEQYGGGKKVEKLLHKAITLPEQKVKNPYLPSWGKQNSYEMLIRWYLRKQDLANARKYHKRALVLYPNSYVLQELNKKLKTSK